MYVFFDYQKILFEYTFLCILQGLDASTTEKDRTIEYEPAVVFTATIGGVVRARINYRDFVHTESCHIVTPNGEEYNLNDATAMSAIGVKNHVDSGVVACGADITVQSETSVGDWVLLSRDTRFSEPIERRVNITINVEGKIWQ